MRKNTKETILEQATILFATDGFNGVSVRTIARAAGITEGSIYNHFKSKVEIMDEILDRHIAELEGALPKSEDLIRAYERDDWKPAWVLRADMMQRIAEPADLSIVVILMNEQYRLDKARQIVMKYYIDEPVHVTCDLLEHIQRKGTVLPADPMTLARAYQYPIFCMMQEYELVLSAGGDVTPVLEKIKAHAAFFWTGVLKRDYEA